MTEHVVKQREYPTFGSPDRSLAQRLWLLALVVLAACGGPGTDSDGGAPAAIRTLAYVVTECFQDNDGVAQGRQRLFVQICDQEPREIFRSPELQAEVPPAARICAAIGAPRFGLASVRSGFFQRLGVSSDGARVVFEVTSEFADEYRPFIVGPIDLEREGIFVWTESEGVRRLAPASRDRSFRSGLAGPVNYITFLSNFLFSPDGRSVTYTDLGPGPDGEEASQIFVLDLEDGQPPQQITRLAVGPGDVLAPDTCCPFFLDQKRIGFLTVVPPPGIAPQAGYTALTVNRDDHTVAAAPGPAALPTGAINSSFLITGPEPLGAILTLDSEPARPREPVVLDDGYILLDRISEAFLLDHDNLLQLTNFGLADMTDVVVSSEHQLAFFNSSVDLGENPTQNCQIFSVGLFDGQVRQLTNFTEVPPGAVSSIGCFFESKPNGCAVALLDLDTVTERLIFYSTCDPFGTNENGSQIFAMRFNGEELEQVTHALGLATGTDGDRLELIGPYAYSATIRHTLRPPLVNPRPSRQTPEPLAASVTASSPIAAVR